MSTANPTSHHETGRSTKGTAVVTGASSGLGKVYAERFAQRGYDLILIARRAERLESLAHTLRTAHGVAVRTLVADLSASTELEQVAATLAADSSITVLVNNAGTSTMAPVAGSGLAQMEAMNRLNVTALARLSHAILPAFKQRNHGTLINIGSVLGIHTLPMSSIYSGTKGYVQNFTRGLQEEVKDTQVVVQLVMPSITATEIWEISGVPLEKLDQNSVMSAADCVDAALAGLDQGELITLPSVEDPTLFAAYDAARLALLAASQNGKPASRYRVGQ
jgi:short-subunit dehydrogenase